MEELKVDLNNLGSTKHAYKKLFTIEEFRQVIKTRQFEQFVILVKEEHKLRGLLYNQPLSKFYIPTILSLITYIFSNSIDIPFNSTITLLVLLLFIFITIKRTTNVTKDLNLKLVAVKNKKESLKKENRIINFLNKHIKSDYYCRPVSEINKLVLFFDKLKEYDDINVYFLEQGVNFPSDDYNVFYNQLIFEENATGNLFSYAYSRRLEDDGTEFLKVLTVFDIDKNTFEYKPRV